MKPLARTQPGLKLPMDAQSTVELVDLGSRGSSAYSRNRSASPSEDEDGGDDGGDDDYDGSQPASSIRPLVRHNDRRERGLWHRLFRQGGLGGFFFGTALGWQVWVGLLVFWTGGCGFGLLLMNRFNILTGIYKLPYPLTYTYMQLLLTHVILATWTALTRCFSPSLQRMGFGAAIAPSAATHASSRSRYDRPNPALRRIAGLFNPSAGIAGGGIFEFNYRTAKHVFPLAAVFAAKVLFSNYSFAYAPLPVYQVARIGVTPLAVIFSCILQKEQYSDKTLSSALIAAMNLLFATVRAHTRVTWESIIAGVVSSVFAALYPVLLFRTHRTIIADLIPQGNLITEELGYRVETRAYYRTLHYISLISIIILTPIVLLSGEPSHIYRNIPFLDVPFFLFMTWCGGLGSFAVFTSTLLLLKATSPFTAVFINVPRSAFQLVMINLFRVPKYSWLGVVLCWLSSLCYLLVRRREGRTDA